MNQEEEASLLSERYFLKHNNTLLFKQETYDELRDLEYCLHKCLIEKKNQSRTPIEIAKIMNAILDEYKIIRIENEI